MLKKEIVSFIKTDILSEPAMQIDDEDNLFESGILDSVGMMRLILFLEKKFSLRVPPEDMNIENFMSLQKISAYFSK